MTAHRVEKKASQQLKTLVSKGNKTKTFAWIPALFQCHSLTELLLGSVCTAEGSQMFCSELEKCLPTSPLRKLKLQRNSIADNAIGILNALSLNTSLVILNLNWNFMGEGKIQKVTGIDDDAERDRLEKLRKQEKEKRRNEGFGAQLCVYITRNTTLRILSLKGNHLTSNECSRLRDVNESMWNRIHLKLEPQIDKCSAL